MTENELYHYGVKGMKWGVIRDARILANSRRNKRVRDAHNAYRGGKITKEARNKEIKAAQADKKASLAKTKRQFENAKSEAERAKIERDIVNKTTREVSNVGLKRSLATANVVFGGFNAASSGAAAVTLMLGNPAFAAAALTAGAVGIASEVGHRYCIQLGLDKIS